MNLTFKVGMKVTPGWDVDSAQTWRPILDRSKVAVWLSTEGTLNRQPPRLTYNKWGRQLLQYGMHHEEIKHSFMCSSIGANFGHVQWYTRRNFAFAWYCRSWSYSSFSRLSVSFLGQFLIMRIVDSKSLTKGFGLFNHLKLMYHSFKSYFLHHSPFFVYQK
jgi:hypothetical protein